MNGLDSYSQSIILQVLIVKGNKKTYSLFNRVSATLMVLALLWLTISAPFVFAAQEEVAKQNKTAKADIPLTDNEEEANPFGNTTEEKAPSSTNFSEEFLHDHHTTDHFFSIVSQYHKCENAATYNAFHGELLVPPPNAA